MRAIRNALDHHLNLAATFLLSEEPCLDDARVVENQQIAGFDELRQVGKFAVMQGTLGQMQQAAGRAFTGRVLGNQIGRKRKIKVVESKHTKIVLRAACRLEANRG